MSTLTFSDGITHIYGTKKHRNNPQIELTFNQDTRRHLKFIKDNNWFDITNTSHWGCQEQNGKTYYYNEYEGNILYLTAMLENGQHALSMGNNRAFDEYLKDNPGSKVLFTISYVDGNGNDIQSELKLTLYGTELSSIGFLIGGLTCAAFFAYGVGSAAEAAAAAGETVGAILGESLSIDLPAAGIILCILTFVGIWLAYIIERQISINISYENRTKDDVYLTDVYTYNMEGAKVPNLPCTISGLSKETIPGVPFPMEYYSMFQAAVANSWKCAGIGLSLKFANIAGRPQDDGVVICLRNDIYKDPHLTVMMTDLTAEEVYSNYGNDGNIPPNGGAEWGQKQISFALDAQGFNNYTFNGVIAIVEPVTNI